MVIEDLPYLPFNETRSDEFEPAQLRARMAEDGYLFVRKLFDPDALLAVRRDVLALCKASGWLHPGVPMMEGRGRSDLHGGHWEGTALYRQVQRLESFHALAHSPVILELMQHLVQSEVLVHPRNIQRVTVPGFVKRTTPPHQDYHLIQGTHRFYTLWFPLGDCPIELGGLAVAPGTHRRGALPICPSEGVGGVQVDVNPDELTWHTSRFELGDALLLTGLTVHRALPNLTGDVYRLSVDFRYQSVNDPVVWDSLEPHMGGVTWKEVYAGWQATTYQYYWHRQALSVVPRVDPNSLVGHGAWDKGGMSGR